MTAVATPAPVDAATPRRPVIPGWAVLAVVLALALAVRLHGVRAGLPFMHHPDEPTNLRVADAMIRAGDPNPRFFNYPSLSVYLWAALHLDGPLLGWIPGLSGEAPLTQVIGVGYAPSTGQVLLARLGSVAAGLGTVAFGWAAARRLTTGVAPAAACGLLLALSPTLVEHSRYVTPDALTAMLVTAAVWASVHVWRSGTWSAYLGAGALVGLAAGTKYTAVLVAVTVAAAALLGGRTSGLWRLPAAGVAAAAAFVASTPYSVLDRPAFLAGIEFEREHYRVGHPGMEGDTVGFYLGHLTGYEPVLLVAAAVGVVAALARARWRPVLLLAAFPAVYGAFIAVQTVRNDRTLMLLLPALAVLAALAVDTLPRPARLPAAALAGVVAAAVVVPTLPTPGPSVQEQARVWLQTSADGRPVLIEGYGPWTPGPGVVYCNRAIDCAPPPGGLVVLASERYARYTAAYPPEHAAYAELLALPATARFDGPDGTIRIVTAP